MPRTHSRWWLVCALVVGVSLAACSTRRAQSPAPAPTPTSTVIPETGVTHDLTDKNGQVVFAKPGDVIAVPLVGQAKSGFQWSFRSPVNGGYLSLKRHTVTENDPRLQPGQFLSEWVLKIEKAATFNLRLDYEKATGRRLQPQQVFRAKIVADRASSAAPDLLLDEPQPEAGAAGTLLVAGFARGTKTIGYRLLTETGGQVASGSISIPEGSAESGFIMFEKTHRFTTPAVPRGRLEVFRAHEPQDVESVPVVFRPDLRTVEIYFSNDRLDAAVSCGKVFPVPRYIPAAAAPAETALKLLLEGPTTDERGHAYRTNLPGGVRLKSLQVSAAAATADFNAALDHNVGGSCRVQAIRAQIEQTLKQFPEITAVTIAIDGRTADILQP